MEKIVYYVLSLFLLANCASISTLQTGRVLEKDKSQHAIGVATYSSDDFVGGESISLPLLEYSYRRGVWDKIDVGAKIALIGSMNADIKYNLVNDEKLAISTGFGLGYLPFESQIGDVQSKVTIIDFTIPLYLSYDVTEMLTAYSAGKYLYRSVSTEGTLSAIDGSMASGTLGVQYGKQAGIFVEASFISGLDNSFSGTQFNFSYFFGF
jgi:hypothetical protein